MEKSQSSGFEVLSAEKLYAEDFGYDTVGVGVQILPCTGDEDCYGINGCSVKFSRGALPHGVTVEDVVSCPGDFEVVVMQSCLCTNYALQRKK